jgi:hypothetical protein
VPSVPGIFPPPNSAPDSFAPTHCRAPDFDVLVALAAVLDEDLGAVVVEDGIIVLGDVLKRSTAGKFPMLEAKSVAEGTIVGGEAGIDTV